MKKAMTILVMIVFSAGLILSGEIPLKRVTEPDKIHKRLKSQFESSSADTVFKVWIFFTDKEISSEAALKNSLASLKNNFSARSVERRIMRRDGEPFDFHDIPVSDRYIDAVRDRGARIKSRSRWLNAVSAYADGNTIRGIAELPFVAEIKPVAIMSKTIPPIEESEFERIPKKSDYKELPDTLKDRYGSSFNQLNLNNIPLLHHLGYTGEGIIIGVFDSGFDTDHPAFAGLTVIAEKDFIIDEIINDGIDTIVDQSSHGTRVLSVIGAYAENQLIGSAYDAAFVLAKTEIDGGANEIKAEEDNWVEAAEWADSVGVDIITSSLSYFDWYVYEDLDGQTADITIAAEIAASRGIVMLNSAGNERNDLWYYITPPSDGPSVIAVGAVTSSGNITSFSSAGPTADGRLKPNVMAQGTEIWTVRYNSISYLGGNVGTSYSCPITAGAAAVLLQLYPQWGPSDIMTALQNAGNRHHEPDNLYGHGVFDLLKAADLLRIDAVGPLLVAVGDTLNTVITASGPLAGTGGENIDTMIALNLPANADFEYLGTGEARLRFEPDNTDVGEHVITIAAAAGYAEARLNLSIEVIVPPAVMTIGPNPFDDSLTIFLNPDAGKLQEVVIYSVSGEKVWEIISDRNNNGPVVVWRGINNSGISVASGVYLIYVRTEKLEKRFKAFKR